MDFVRKTTTGAKSSIKGTNEYPLKKCGLDDNKELTRKNPKYSILSLKKKCFEKASSSGLGSSENYSIETVSSTNSGDNGNLNSTNKRLLDRNEPVTFENKKIKFNDKPNIKSKLNETKIEVFQDTLDNLDVSSILKNSVSKNTLFVQENQLDKTCDKTEFDAFANILNESDEYNEVQKISSKLFENKEKNSLQTRKENIPNENREFSQSFNTQVINHLDSVLRNEESNCKSMSENIHTKDPHVSLTLNEKKNEEELFKSPLLKSFEDKILAIKAKEDKRIGDRSMLFTDKSITIQYKKEVDNLFEQIEHTICSMGTEVYEKRVPDKILDVIFADENITVTSEIDNNATHQGDANKNMTKWSDESILDGANCSFGTLIRQALINNANKTLQPQIDSTNLDCSLNRSLSSKEPELRSLGNFYDLPTKVKDLIKQYKGIEHLYDWQDECLKLAISNRNNLIYALPTSGGKTLVAEILMLREVMCYDRNAIFILPYVAIVQEKVWDFSPFGVALDFLVEEYASSKGVYPPRKRRRKHSVYIATIEKALGLINSLIETGRLHEIGLIVIDELHLIGEEGRGATLEACLTKIRYLNSNIKIVGMSATIGNIEDICKFLNAEVYTKDFRPVELSEYVKCGSEIAKINWKAKGETDLLVDVKKLDYKYSEAVSKLDPDMLGGLALEVVPKDSCLVFCPSKKNCENVVYLLCKLAKPDLKNFRKSEKEQLLHALKSEAGELCDILKISVPFGLAYHHSGLTNDERRLLEDAFRAGTISVICCTSTLAAGVNLPARRVILRSPYIGKEFINLSRYKQMAGRAGRAGLGETGESIIITNPLDLHKVKALLMSPMNQALSSLHCMDGRGLRHLLLSCISLGIGNTRAELQKVAKTTLMAVQMDKLNVNNKKLTDTVIKNLFKLGALQEGSATIKESANQNDVSVKMDTSLVSLTNPEISSSSDTSSTASKKPKRTIILSNNTKLVVSNLGAAAIKGGLDLSRAHQLYDDLYQAQKSLVLLNVLHLLYLVTPYETAEQVRPNIQVYYDVLTHLNEKETQTAKILGFDDAVTLKMATGQATKQVPEKVLNRFYVTLMLYDLWNEKPIFEVSEKFQINRGIVQNLMTISASFTSNVVNFCEQLEEFWAFAFLLKGMSQRLSHCCIRELLPLMELPAVKQSRAKQLYNAGYKNLQSIAKAKVNDLVENIEFMSRRTATQLIAASKMLLLEKVENLREEAEDVLDGVENPKQLLNVSLVPFK